MQVGNSFVFAGYRDDVQPFDPTGAYIGDGNVREIEVAPGVRIAVGVSGSTTFGVGSGIDVMQVMEDLQVALDANDVVGIRATLDDLSGAHAQVTDERVKLGASMNSFEVVKSATERSQDRANENRMELIGVEMTDAFSELARAEQALQAAITVASKLPFPGLINMMG
jgi:flagellar hook-associated protein 3 FlgL